MYEARVGQLTFRARAWSVFDFSLKLAKAFPNYPLYLLSIREIK